MERDFRTMTKGHGPDKFLKFGHQPNKLFLLKSIVHENTSSTIDFALEFHWMLNWETIDALEQMDVMEEPILALHPDQEEPLANEAHEVDKGNVARAHSPILVPPPHQVICPVMAPPPR